MDGISNRGAVGVKGNVYDADAIVGHNYSCLSPKNGKPSVVWKQLFPEPNKKTTMVGKSCLTALIKNFFVELPELYLDCFQTQPPKIIEHIVENFGLTHATKEIETLKEIDRGLLSKMPLALLTSNILRQWLVQNLSAANHEIFGISIKEFSELDWRQRRVILKRLEHIELKEPLKGDFPKHSIGMIRQMKTEEFFAQFPHVPNYALELLTKTQRDRCDFSRISTDTLRRLLEKGNLLFGPLQMQKIEFLIALDDIEKETCIRKTLLLLEQQALEEQLSTAKKKLRSPEKPSAVLDIISLPDNTPFPDFDPL